MPCTIQKTRIRKPQLTLIVPLSCGRAHFFIACFIHRAVVNEKGTGRKERREEKYITDTRQSCLPTKHGRLGLLGQPPRGNCFFDDRGCGSRQWCKQDKEYVSVRVQTDRFYSHIVWRINEALAGWVELGRGILFCVWLWKAIHTKTNQRYTRNAHVHCTKSPL